MPEPSRSDRRRAERKAELYRIALELFVEHGFDKVRVQDITAAADVSKGTFFNYFPSKEHLLVEYRQSLLDSIHDFGEALEGDSARGLLKQYFRKLARRIKAEGERYGMLLKEVIARPHLVAQAERQGSARSYFMRYLEVGRAAGEIPEDCDLELLAQTLRDLWAGVSTHWLMEQPAVSLETQMMRRLDFLFDLLEASAGE